MVTVWHLVIGQLPAHCICKHLEVNVGIDFATTMQLMPTLGAQCFCECYFWCTRFGLFSSVPVSNS